ncbi:class I SAM-dependent methyltransferase [Mycobacterium basiliense]|nr:class I SAM-dependent methyltransferase [Mycobacterium basiliense]
MAMNLVHRLCCNSDRWAKEVRGQVLPWVLADVDLGESTLEIGPGYGAFLRVLVDQAPNLTAIEIDTAMAQRLQDLYGDRARIINGDGTDTALPGNEFSSVVCFTMLHHVPTVDLQDRLFAEAFRVLRPGGVFAGSDGVPSLVFSILHFRDTCNPIAPATLPDRLRTAGFHDAEVEVRAGRQRWRALKPAV